MISFAGYTQMGMRPAAGDARACGRSRSQLAWQLADLAGTSASGAMTAIPTFVDVPKTHRHRRPWGTS